MGTVGVGGAKDIRVQSVQPTLPHYTDEENEIQRGEVTCPGAQSKLVQTQASCTQV